jgi:DNA-binding NarL/FixJ family response regulator
LKQLTDREKQILLLLASGKKQKQIAEQLNISKYTVKNIIANITNKTGISGAVNLTNYARDNRIST